MSATNVHPYVLDAHRLTAMIWRLSLPSQGESSKHLSQCTTRSDLDDDKVKSMSVTNIADVLLCINHVRSKIHCQIKATSSLLGLDTLLLPVTRVLALLVGLGKVFMATFGRVGHCLYNSRPESCSGVAEVNTTDKLLT